MSTVPRTSPDSAVDPSEREWFTELFGRCYDELAAYFARRVAPSDIEDLVVEVFTITWRRRKDVDPKRARLWLYGVAANVLANYRRSSERRAALTLRIIQERMSATTAKEDERGEGALLLAGLEQLPPNDLEVLLLRVWDGLAISEVAAVLNCTPTAARVRLHRARRKLAAILTDAGGLDAHRLGGRRDH